MEHIRHTKPAGEPKSLPAEFPLFLIFFLKCYEEVTMNAAAFIKKDFQVEFVRDVFHRDGNLISTLLGKSDIDEVFFDAIKGEITTARNKPLGFSFRPQLLSFVHHGNITLHLDNRHW
jgi:hypothetical protein